MVLFRKETMAISILVSSLDIKEWTMFGKPKKGECHSLVKEA